MSNLEKNLQGLRQQLQHQWKQRQGILASRARANAVGESSLKNPKNTAEGYRIVDRTYSWPMLIVKTIVILFVEAISIAVVWGLVLMSFSEAGFSLLFSALIVVFSLLALTLPFGLVYQILIVFLYGPGELFLSEWPLQMGSDVSFKFRKVLHPWARLQEEHVLDLYLVCAEVVYHGSGEDISTSIKPVYEEKLPGQVILAGVRVIEANWSTRIPSNFSPSRNGRNCRFVWGLIVDLDMSRSLNPPKDVFCLHIER